MRSKKLTWLVSIVGLALYLTLVLSAGRVAIAAERESALYRIQRKGVIRVGWALWFPWMIMDEKTKKLTGISPDVIEELAKALGNVKIEWVADNWATLPAGLQANKFDITYPLVATLPRALVCEFTDDTMREADSFLLKKKDAARFKTFEDVDQPSVKIATTLGSGVELDITRLFKKAEIIRFKSSPEGLMAMMLGKADLWGNSGAALVDAQKQQPDTIIMKGYFALGRNCMAVQPGDQLFLNWLNLFIADMKNTGTLDRIFRKYGAKREIFFD